MLVYHLYKVGFPPLTATPSRHIDTMINEGRAHSEQSEKPHVFLPSEISTREWRIATLLQPAPRALNACVTHCSCHSRMLVLNFVLQDYTAIHNFAHEQFQWLYILKTGLAKTGPAGLLVTTTIMIKGQLNMHRLTKRTRNIVDLSCYGRSLQLVVPRNYVQQPQTVSRTIHGTAEGSPRTICGTTRCLPLP